MKKLRITEYDREAAVDYAKEWALSYNPRYKRIDGKGEGTNFVSQCLFSGAGIMNYDKSSGWYYKSEDDMSRAWTDTEELYRFLINNKGEGPFAQETDLENILPGDIVQTGKLYSGFSASLIVVAKCGENICICAHNANAYMRNLSTVKCEKIRCLHIKGIRQK